MLLLSQTAYIFLYLGTLTKILVKYILLAFSIYSSNHFYFVKEVRFSHEFDRDQYGKLIFFGRKKRNSPSRTHYTLRAPAGHCTITARTILLSPKKKRRKKTATASALYGEIFSDYCIRKYKKRAMLFSRHCCVCSQQKEFVCSRGLNVSKACKV